MAFSQKQLIILGGAAVLVLALVGLVMFAGKNSNVGPKVTLSLWGTDNKANIDPLISFFRSIRPNVTINYTSFPEEKYESELIKALAAGEGPDIFFLKSTAIPRNLAILSPVAKAQFDAAKVDELFPRVVGEDFIQGGELYGLPLSIDTLALIYNKDAFDRAAIVNPPLTWDNFLSAVSSLRQVSESGEIMKPGAAIGGSEKTIPDATEILEALIMQNGATMFDEVRSQAVFAESNGGKGLRALSFYTQFSDAASSYYTWNDAMKNSRDSFAAGETPIIFDYKKTLESIRAKNQFLRIGVALLPQVDDSVPINLASYNGMVVSKQSKNANWAWDFILNTAANADGAKVYAESSGNIPALRSLLTNEISKPVTGVFAREALTARSWYKADDKKIEDIFNSAIQKVLTGEATPESALRSAQSEVNQLVKTR